MGNSLHRNDTYREFKKRKGEHYNISESYITKNLEIYILGHKRDKLFYISKEKQFITSDGQIIEKIYSQYNNFRQIGEIEQE